MTRFWKCCPSNPLTVKEWGPGKGRPQSASIRQVSVRAEACAGEGARTRSPSQALTESPPAEAGPGRAAEGRAGTGQMDRFHPEERDHPQDVSVPPHCAQHLGPLPGAWNKTTAATRRGLPTRRGGFISTSWARPQEVLANRQGLPSTTSGTRSPPHKTRVFSTTRTCLLGWQVSTWELLT